MFIESISVVQGLPLYFKHCIIVITSLHKEYHVRTGKDRCKFTMWTEKSHCSITVWMEKSYCSITMWTEKSLCSIAMWVASFIFIFPCVYCRVLVVAFEEKLIVYDACRFRERFTITGWYIDIISVSYLKKILKL